jgi:hypothetical protein
MFRRSVGPFVAALSVVALLTAAQPALAGYVTWLVYPFDIGKAQSLPWGDDWSRGRADYNLANLIPDTDALLTPSTPIVVRLETLRRAVIYASRDRQIAESLLLTFAKRARGADPSGNPGALAFLDAAFVTDALWQVGQHDNPPFTELSRQVHGLVAGAGGYALVQRGLALHPDDPAYEFAAALIAGVAHLGSPEFIAHARKAIAGSSRDALIARNLDRIYADQITRFQAVVR